MEYSPINVYFDDTTEVYVTFDVAPSTGGGGGSATLTGLTDVNIDTPLNDEALVYDALTSKWINKAQATAPTYTNANPSAITVGGIPSGTTFSNRTMTNMFDDLLYPELYPTFTNPSNTFALSQQGLHEIGEVVSTLNFAATFNRGTITPSYGTSGFRSGVPNTYIYTGSGFSNVPNNSLTDNNTVSNYSVLLGVQTWGGSVAYNIGEQPKSSKDNNYSTPLAAGTTSVINATITGVYPLFATNGAINTLSKLALQLMNSAYIQVTMMAESGIFKQKIDIPTAWSTITGIQQYNTLSGTWDLIGGSKANSLLTFTVTSVNNTIQGNTVTYNRFTHNGSLIGSRQLRFITT